MTVEKSRRTVLFLATLALGAITLGAPAALAASPLHVRPHAQAYRMADPYHHNAQARYQSTVSNDWYGDAR